ncbi:hypothetical protein C8Q79DRAFT_954948 [Trametes meyenii]|nr:hypothetical protein C8Q79DRAFT_954948 [Trametes meyenii]
MPLASSGLRALRGTQAHFFPSGGTTQAGARAIHIPAAAPRVATSQTTSTAQSVFKHTKTLLTRFVAHLTTPGTLRTPGNVSAGARAFHGPATRMPTIHERMSYPARCFLSRPPTVPFLPRAPGVPRNVIQVGLGTARNFSTGRPVFQHLAENVPIYARAFNQADWKVRMQEERERMKLEKANAKAYAKAARKAKAPLRAVEPAAKAASVATVDGPQEELEHYFSTPSAPEVTTHLLIPLAPTPTSRMPLSPNPPSSRPLLPIEAIASMHTSHGTHALRVSSLFARLDTSRVFDDPTVHCEARGDYTGLCTVLEIRFEGWTANRVRSILGEAGTGWCVLEEVWHDEARVEADEMDAALETLSTSGSERDSHLELASLSGLSDVNGSWGASSAGIDPAHSFVLPTLDFSASFAAPAWSSPASLRPANPSTPASANLEFHNAWSEVEEDDFSSPDSFDYDLGSDVESVGSAWFERSSAARRSEDSWPRFSSHFSERMRDAEEPREQLL